MFVQMRAAEGGDPWVAVKMACLTCVAMVFATPAWAQNRVWNNSQGNNNFGDLLNWTFSENPPPDPLSFLGTNADWRITSVGASRAEVTTAIGDIRRDISVGRGAAGELFVGLSGSFNAIRDVYAGLNSSGNGIITVEGAFTSRDIKVGDGTLGALSVGSSGSVSGRDVYAGSSDASGKGIITVEGALSATRDFFVGDARGEGRLFIDGGSVSATGDIRLGRAGENDGYGIVEINGGGTISGNRLFVGQSNRAQNLFTLNDGTVTVATALQVAPQGNSQGSLVINGGSLTAANGVFADAGANPSTATLTVTGGSLTTTTGALTFAGANGGATATMNLSGTGAISSATSVSFGSGSNSSVNVTITGGTLSAPSSFVTFGQGAGSTTTVTMSGGVISADRVIFANDGTSTLNMTSGTINTAAELSSGTQSTKGALVMGSAGASINLGGDAFVDAEKLYINAGGVLDLAGEAVINVAGAADGRATFDFSSGLISPIVGGGWDTVNGKINFSSLDSVLQVTGASQTITVPSAFTYNFANLFNQAIANGVITKSVAAWEFQVVYDAGSNLTTVSVVVPEPSAFVLGLGGVAVLGLAVRARRRRGRALAAK